MAQYNLYLFNLNKFNSLTYDGAKALLLKVVIKLYFHFIKMYSCEYCTKSFIQKDHLLRHKREVHEWILRFECEKCEKKILKKARS